MSRGRDAWGTGGTGRGGARWHGPTLALVNTLRIVLDALAAVLVVATVLPLYRSSEWWVRMFDFPRMQIAGLAIVVLVAYVAVVMFGDPTAWEWVLLVGLAMSTVYQAARMAPYTRIHTPETVAADPAIAAPDRRLRLMVTNVLMENREGDRWLAEVRRADPDVVVAVETDQWWADTARDGLADDYPHAVEEPRDTTYGIIVRSKLPIDAVEVRHLVEEEVPSLTLTIRLRSGEHVTLVALHPRPPRPDIQQDSDLRDAELAIAGRGIAEIDGPVVACGDFNDVAWSDSTALFQQLSGLLDPRIGRGTFSTFHADHWWLRYPLDHVFHTDHFALVDIQRLGNVGSDHLPILIELELNPTFQPNQDGPEADQEDMDEASEKVDSAREKLATESEAEKQERVEEDQ